jgi:hypothetical protein
MEEKEVLKRLGFKEEKELASIEQLQDYNISYAEDDENYFNLSDKDGKKPEKIIESFLQYHRYLLPVFHYAYGRVTITGWRAWLENEVVYFHKGARHDKSWIQKRYETRENMSKHDESKDDATNETTVMHVDSIMSSGGKKSYPIDAGHVLAKLTNLTPLISDYLGSNQNSNNINTYPQFKSANEKDCKDDHDYGQLHFEREALSNLPCYYEAEAIIQDWNDVVPIGTRIRMIDATNFKEHFHVFIPNIVYENTTTDHILSDKNEVDDYRAFFKGGDLNSLKWKKVDTPKNK